MNIFLFFIRITPLSAFLALFDNNFIGVEIQSTYESPWENRNTGNILRAGTNSTTRKSIEKYCLKIILLLSAVICIQIQYCQMIFLHLYTILFFISYSRVSDLYPPGFFYCRIWSQSNSAFLKGLIWIPSDPDQAFNPF